MNSPGTAMDKNCSIMHFFSTKPSVILNQSWTMLISWYILADEIPIKHLILIHSEALEKPMRLIVTVPSQQRSLMTPSQIPAAVRPWRRTSLSVKLHFLLVILHQKTHPLLHCSVAGCTPGEIWSQFEQVCAMWAHIDCLFISRRQSFRLVLFVGDKVLANVVS